MPIELKDTGYETTSLLTSSFCIILGCMYCIVLFWAQYGQFPSYLQSTDEAKYILITEAVLTCEHFKLQGQYLIWSAWTSNIPAYIHQLHSVLH